MRPTAALACRKTSFLCVSRIWSRSSPTPPGKFVTSRGGLSRSWHIPLKTHHHVVDPRSLQSRSLVIQVHNNGRYQEPTIYALSSAPGRAAIAVIRVSGPASRDVYHAICPSKSLPKPRVAAVRTLYEPWQRPSVGTVLDSSALVLYFPGPGTATGEDILELHVHGGPAIVKSVLGAISRCGSTAAQQIRYAEPGEFTRRAFMNNRMDLTQVEALGDTLSADTEQQRRLSVRGTTGVLAKRYEAWRQQLLYARGELEALIDFSEDQHFDESPAELCSSVAEQVQSLRKTLQIHSKNAVRGELLRHGISVSLLGAPNAGKSSLLNRIVGREAAIVSNEAGTTRDIVEIGLDLGGYFCRFGDTAGLRQADSHFTDNSTKSPEAISLIEQEGMRRAKERAADSDVVVVVLSFEQTSNNLAELQFDPEVCSFARRLVQEKDNVIIVINKADLPTREEADNAIRLVQDQFPGLVSASDRRQERVHMVSCIAEDATDYMQSADPGGIQRFLREGLLRQFRELTAALTGEEDAADGADLSVWQESLGASERHRVLLDACIGYLDAFLHEVAVVPSGAGGIPGVSQDRADVVVAGMPETKFGAEEADIVAAAEHLRSAAECLAKITGKGVAGDVEEVLGVVFEKFCVGK